MAGDTAAFIESYAQEGRRAPVLCDVKSLRKELIKAFNTPERRELIAAIWRKRRDNEPK